MAVFPYCGAPEHTAFWAARCCDVLVNDPPRRLTQAALTRGDIVPTSVINSPAHQRMRAELKEQWQPMDAACALCGRRPSTGTQRTRVVRAGPHHQPQTTPELALDPSNCSPSHVRCNRSKGAGPATPAIGEITEDW